MKNDVASALTWLGLSWGLWAVGRRVTVGRSPPWACCRRRPDREVQRHCWPWPSCRPCWRCGPSCRTPWPTTGRPAASRRRRLPSRPGSPSPSSRCGVRRRLGRLRLPVPIRPGAGRPPGPGRSWPTGRSTTSARPRGNPAAARRTWPCGRAVFADRHHLLPQALPRRVPVHLRPEPGPPGVPARPAVADRVGDVLPAGDRLQDAAGTLAVVGGRRGRPPSGGGGGTGPAGGPRSALAVPAGALPRRRPSGRT